MPTIANERVVYYRERAAGMYRPGTFASSQGIVEIPYLIVQSVAYSLITYFMIGFEMNPNKFFWFFFFILLNLTAFTYFGIMSINLTPAVQIGTVLTAFFFTTWNFLCGFLIAPTNIPGQWIWLYYINPLSYTLYGLAASQLSDVNTLISNPTAPPGSPPQTVSEYLSSTYGYNHSFFGWCSLILFGFIVAFRAIAAYSLWKFNFQKR